MKLNYYNFTKFGEEYLLTNDQGKYIFLNKNDFEALTNEKLDAISTEVLTKLKEKSFIFESKNDPLLERAIDAYRFNKEYIFSGTSLHIFVLTNFCNMACIYCQAGASGNKKEKMTARIAEQAVDIAIQSPMRNLSFEFQGGEPLSNFEIIKHIVEYTDRVKNDKNIDYTIVTNSLLMTDEMISYFKDHSISISTSLDGNRLVHDKNRRMPGGIGTFDKVAENITKLKQNGVSVGAIETTTRYNLPFFREIVDTYLELGLDTVFIRPLTPLGYALDNWTSIGYSAEDFLTFYCNVLAYIIELNKAGKRIMEGHAILFLRKILTPGSGNYMELRSPCGAGTGQIAYNYDGSIYTCDEGRMLAEMGDESFKMGDISSNYNDLMNSKACRLVCLASILEGTPGCCDCIFNPYCGICPVINYSVSGNLFLTDHNGFRCKVYKGILMKLFEYIKDTDTKKIFQRWVGCIDE